MTKEKLAELGLGEELAETVAKASAEELKGFIPKQRFDEVSKQLKEAKQAADGVGDAESIKAQLEKLQAESKAKDEAHAAEIQKMKLDGAVDAALTASGARSAKAVRALLELNGAELGDDGTVKGLGEQLEKLQKDCAYLFETGAQRIKGAEPSSIPASQTTYDTRIADARKRGDFAEVIALKQQAANDGMQIT